MTTIQHDLFGIPFGPVELKILSTLIGAYPDKVERFELADAVYSDDPEGGPEHANTVLRVMVARLRRKLTGTGWTIPKMKTGTGEAYGGYRLAREH
jgi:DNA-binding winged helix-turn-helix (wHTH) protein